MIRFCYMRLLINENLSLEEDGTWWIRSSRKKKQGLISKCPLWVYRFISLKNIVIWPLREIYSPSIERRRKVEYLLLFEE